MARSDVIGALILLAYYLVVCVAIPAPLKYWTRIPSEVIRKAQHIAYSMSIFLLLNLFTTWYAAIGASFLLVLIGYPVLWFIERTKWYSRAFADRTIGGGEFRNSLLMVQATFGVLIAIFWGVFGARWAPVIGVAVTGWGFGDAAAALVGKAWGRRHVLLRWVDRAKTYEGTAAMISVACAAIGLALVFYAGLPWYRAVVISVIVSPVCGLVELVTRRGFDTITVPLATAFLLFSLMDLFARIGW